MSVQADLSVDDLRVSLDETREAMFTTAHELAARVNAHSSDANAVVLSAALLGLLRQERQLRQAIRRAVAG